MSSPSEIWLPSSLSTMERVRLRMRQAATPEGMRDRLYLQLKQRLPLVQKLVDYYEGRHAFSFATEKFRNHAPMMAAVSDNWMPLVCRSPAQRIGIEGLPLSTTPRPEDGDDPLAKSFVAWDQWRRSDLDEHSPKAWLEAIKLGEAYWLAEVVGTQPNGRPDVRVTVEHPASMIVARSAGDPTTATAALKSWTDEWGVEHCTVWTATHIYRWERIGSREWAPASEGDIERHPFAGVPVIPIVNDPQTLPAKPPQILISEPHGLNAQLSVGYGRSDLLDVIETQDAVNKLVRDLLIAAEYQSFRQRYVTGFMADEERDGEGPPFLPGPGNIWTAADPDAKFGEFGEVSLEAFLRAIENRVDSAASRTAIPAHYFLSGTSTLPSGETLRAAEAGLIAKTRDKFRSFGGSVRRLNGLVLPVTNPELAGARVDPDWVDPEVRTESEHVDSLVKKLSIGVPAQQLWADAGYSPEQIARFRSMLREQALDAGVMSLLNPATPAAPGELDPPTPDAGGPVPVVSAV